MVKGWQRELPASAFPPVSRHKARRIAANALANNDRSDRLICHSTKPRACNIWGTQPEPCWYIYASWSGSYDGTMIRSSHMILVGKLTGVIHYDGSAGD